MLCSTRNDEGPPLLSQVDSVHDTSSLLSSIFPDQCCNIPWLAARLGIREEVSDLDALGRATLLARLCGRVHRISALAFPQSAEKEWVGFLNLARELDAMLELPPEFGIAYLQRHLTIGYNSATRSMNQLCRMGIVEWSLDGRGKMIFERPSVVGDSGFFCS